MAGLARPALPFGDRRAAGRALAELVADALSPGEQPPREQLVVLALPRGGVPVAFEVALALDAPLDVIIVRKLGVPSQPELAMGALGEDGVRVLNPEVIRQLRVSERALQGVEAREREELHRRARQFRGDAPMLPIDDRTVVIVDDGLATGSTARAAIQVARAHGARRVVLAVPVAPLETLDELAPIADAAICVASPQPFLAIGQWYRDFRQTTDAEVSRLLAEARQSRDRAGRSPMAHDGGGPSAAPQP
jgi:putative phosphoribosyl transferase